jgi:hypothetical protein
LGEDWANLTAGRQVNLRPVWLTIAIENEDFPYHLKMLARLWLTHDYPGSFSEVS